MDAILIPWGILSFFILLTLLGPKITDRYEFPNRDSHWTIKQCIFVGLLSGPITWLALVVWGIIRVIAITFRFLGK